MKIKALAFAAAAIALASCGGHSPNGVVPRAPAQDERALPHTAPTPAHWTSWRTWGYNRQRTGYNPDETVLSTATVAGLTEKWTFATANRFVNTQPIVLSGIAVNGKTSQVLYAGDEGGHLYAVDASTGTQLWAKSLGTVVATGCGGISSGLTSQPVYDATGNRLFVLDATGVLRAFDPATGSQPANFPAMQAFGNSGVATVWSALQLSSDDSTLYFPTASHCDVGKYDGTIDAVNLQTQAITTFNLVTHPKQYYGNGVWGWGGPAIDPDDGNLYAGVGNSQGSLGETGQYSDSIAEISPRMTFIADEQPENNLTADLDIGTTPVLYDDGGYCAAFQRKDGMFFTIKRFGIKNGAYGSKFAFNGTLGTPAYDPVTHALYVAIPRGLTKLDVGPNCTAKFDWQVQIGATGYGVPVIANGVVYAAGGNVLYAVDANTGSVLWNSGSTITGNIAAAPAVVNGRVYVAAWDGHLYSFGL